MDYRNGVDLGRSADREAAAQYERFPGLNEERAPPFQTVVLVENEKMKRRNKKRIEIRFWKAEQPMQKHPEVEQEHARLRSLLCRGKYGMYV